MRVTYSGISMLVIVLSFTPIITQSVSVRIKSRLLNLSSKHQFAVILRLVSTVKVCSDSAKINVPN